MREIKIGKQTFEIHYRQNAICALEEELDSPIFEILSRIEKGRAKLAERPPEIIQTRGLSLWVSQSMVCTDRI